MMVSKKFPLFPALPPEIRLQIWREALGEVAPALYKWKPGCFQPRSLVKDDCKGYQPESTLVLEFRHNMLGTRRFKAPVVSVNREAREVAFCWALERGIIVQPAEQPSRHGQMRNYAPPILARYFEPACDVLYVPFERWDDFFAEHLLRPMEDDMADESYTDRCHIRAIAFPETLLQRDREDCHTRLSDLFDAFSYVEVLYAIVDPQPKLSPLWRCEVETAQGWGLVWKKDRTGKIASSAYGIATNDQELCRSLEIQLAEIREDLGQSVWTRPLEIHIVHISS